jgi:hypothetical protein
MKRTTWLTLMAGLAGWLAAPAWAAEVTRTPNLNGFRRIDAHSAFQVEVRRGDTFRVEVRADDEVIGDTDIHTVGDRLVLAMKNNWSGWRHWHGDAVRVSVTMPELVEYRGSGATRAMVTGFRNTSSRMEIELSGASRVEADMELNDVRVDLSGASRASLRGRGRGVDVQASGASRADLAEFTASSASLNLSGASQASVNTNGRIDIRASGASHVSYLGHPQLGSIDTSGASSIRAR